MEEVSSSSKLHIVSNTKHPSVGRYKKKSFLYTKEETEELLRIEMESQTSSARWSKEAKKRITKNWKKSRNKE